MPDRLHPCLSPHKRWLCALKATFPKNKMRGQQRWLTGDIHMRLSGRDFQERFGMKKTYEKPVLVRKGRLAAVVAQSVSPVNGAG